MNQNRCFLPISSEEEAIGHAVVNAASETVNPVWEAQILSHLKLTGKRLGYLINFNVPRIKEGIKRFVL